MLIKTRGICLHTSKYAESSVIAQVFTAEKGLQSYIISGVRAARPKVHASLLQPLTLLDMVVYWHPQRSLFRTKELRAAYTFEKLPFELARGAVALFAAEVLLKALRKSDAVPDLFSYVETYIVHVDSTDFSLQNLPAYFLLHLCAFLGVEPEKPDFGAPYFFDQTQGYFVPEAPDHGRYAHEDASAFLVELQSASLADEHEIAADRDVRLAAISSLLDYLQGQIEGFSGITSHQILAQVTHS